MTDPVRRKREVQAVCRLDAAAQSIVGAKLGILGADGCLR